MQADWELSQTLVSDYQGVRCAAVLPSDDENTYRIIAGNQSGGLCEYAVPSGDIKLIPFQHDHAVTAVLSGDGIYATGCKDSMIRIFSAADHTVQATLKGHEKPVTSLAWCDPKQRYLVSGSWDGTARIWNTERNELVATLGNHENSVCVAGVRRDGDCLTIATGSAGIAQNNAISGHSVRMWEVNVATGNSKLLHTVANDHDGPIRDLCCVASTAGVIALIATCSNDGTVKLRDAATGKSDSTLVFVHQQHPPMLLSVVSGDNYLAAGAEDGHVVVWDMETHQQSSPQILRHAQCVWNVVALPNGDLATCCQDGCLRIFTRATERMAATEVREQFAADVQEALQKTQNGPSPDEVAKLPRWEYNGDKQGTSDGQVQLFQKNGVAIAAQWSAASQTWIEVGEVTGKADTGEIDGVRYDHVFPIEVDQTGGGVAKLQIGYNNGENPFVAAQRFIDAHMLPQHHLAEIANYIQQRAGHQPATLGAAVSSAAMAGTPIASYQYLPMKTYKCFELSEKTAVTTLDKMKNKVKEFGWENNLSEIEILMGTLATSNRYHSSKVEENELSAVDNMLQSLPVSQAFPALDLARLAVLHPDAASTSRTSYWSGILQRAVDLCNTDVTLLDGPAGVAIPMLSLRLFANAFKGGPGSRDAVVAHMTGILDCAEGNVKSNNKNIRLSVATVLHNACFYLHQEKSCPDDVASKIILMFDKIINAKTYESEALFRTLVALGTLVMVSPKAKEEAKSLFMASKVEPAASPHDEKVKSLAKEVYSVLQ